MPILGDYLMTMGDWINLGMLVVSVLSALIAGGSFWFTYYQWQKLKKKIAMIDTSGKAAEILPAWYTKRMMPVDLGGGAKGRDYWPFGLLISDGRTIVITGILSLSDDGKWMDVELAPEDFWSVGDKSNYVFAVCDRKTASVQVSHVVAAVELASS